MEGLQICVRMTDGISFSFSPIATVTKGLLKQQRIRQKKERGRGVGGEKRHTQDLAGLTQAKVPRPKRPDHLPHPLGSPDCVPHIEAI